MTEPIFTDEQQAEIKRLMHEALAEFFSGSGKTVKNFLVGAAIVVGSVTVILAGAKSILVWAGFTYMR